MIGCCGGLQVIRVRWCHLVEFVIDTVSAPEIMSSNGGDKERDERMSSYVGIDTFIALVLLFLAVIV